MKYLNRNLLRVITIFSYIIQLSICSTINDDKSGGKASGGIKRMKMQSKYVSNETWGSFKIQASGLCLESAGDKQPLKAQPCDEKKDSQKFKVERNDKEYIFFFRTKDGGYIGVENKIPIISSSSEGIKPTNTWVAERTPGFASDEFLIRMLDTQSCLLAKKNQPLVIDGCNVSTYETILKFPERQPPKKIDIPKPSLIAPSSSAPNPSGSTIPLPVFPSNTNPISKPDQGPSNPTPSVPIKKEISNPVIPKVVGPIEPNIKKPKQNKPSMYRNKGKGTNILIL
jgi:hypothetical protein